MRRTLFLVMLSIGLLALLAAPALASAATFTVHPSGGNDTAHLKAAFKSAVAAGPRSVVQLTAGHFTINDVLVQDFDGTFKGAGRGSTVIGCPKGGVKLRSGEGVCLLGFRGGAVTVSDMSFDITSPTPAATWTSDLPDFEGQNLTFIEGVLNLDGQSSATVERVGFTGYANDPEGGFGGYNVDRSVMFAGIHSFAMRGCTCTTGEGCLSLDGSNAQVTIGGSYGNVFDTPGIGCYIEGYNDSRVSICGNRFHCGWLPETINDGPCVEIVQDPSEATTPSQVLISCNTMRQLTTFGVELTDWANPGAPLIEATIAGNIVDLGTADNPALFFIGELDTQNIKCLGNVVSGYAYGGVPVGDGFIPQSGWRIVGNDFRKLTASWADVGLLQGTSHCLVVGGPPPTTVIDQGIDNILVNCILLPDPPAPLVAPQTETPLGQLRSLKQTKPF